MPSELFGDVSQRPPSARSRNRAIVVGSISMHAVVLTGALFFSLSSPGVLPVPRAALAFVDLSPEITMVDIELPALAPSRPLTATEDAVELAAAPDISSVNWAPVIAPTGIADETGAESAARTMTRTAVDGVERGAAPGALLNITRVEKPPAMAVVQAPVRMHSGIREPTKTAHVDPTYPTIAQQARVQGVVILEAVIGVSGRVESVQVLRSIPLLDAAAVAAVRQWQYRPATLNDQPIPVIVTVTVNFKL